MTAPLASTASAANAITRVKFTHDAMIDYIIANPEVKQGHIAKVFGFTEAWISRIFCSDAFQARLAARKDELVNPVLVQGLEDRFKGLAMQSMEILEAKLEATKSPDLAIKALELSTKALGYGARKENVAVQNNFVVHVPNKIEDAQQWASAHRPQEARMAPMEAQIIDAPVREVA